MDILNETKRILEELERKEKNKGYAKIYEDMVKQFKEEFELLKQSYEQSTGEKVKIEFMK